MLCFGGDESPKVESQKSHRRLDARTERAVFRDFRRVFKTREGLNRKTIERNGMEITRRYRTVPSQNVYAFAEMITNILKIP